MKERESKYNAYELENDKIKLWIKDHTLLGFPSSCANS